MDSVGTGSIMVDAILVLVAIVSLTTGYRQGGVSAFLSLLGVLLGGTLGVKILPKVMDKLGHSGTGGEEFASDTSPGVRILVALIIVAGSVVIGYAIGSGIGAKLRDRIPTRSLMKVDSVAGAVVQVVTAMIVVWMIFVPAASNNKGELGQSLAGSHGLKILNHIMPGWVKGLPAQTAALVNSSGFPVITDPLERLPKTEVTSPDPQLKASPMVKRLQPSVVKVVGEARQCQRLLQGTGFVVAPGTIMTNAHVVAGTDTVTLLTAAGTIDAAVTYYNPSADIALLTADGLDAPVLPWAETPAQHGDDVVVLGYPQAGDYTATPARIRDSFVVSGPNIYANQRVEREAYSLRGDVVQGNSGGPLVDTDGHVLGLVFGADLNEADTGYALTKNEVMKQVGDLGAWTAPVDTQACVLN
ncbi:MarP family serine protease [Corynebacterium zhongnanshanii]|uniref:Serine protease n=1 Tax=Corynebacterium zhongnanshanii TaxID=2768834 RepID=A0ABQ6VDW5_9CORY|nr:MarP family serine protease [Corynebacterium zhongnanshanii]KAB3522637.1 MarP family serine protease [Corynebacterium zhongnanshanii]